MGSVASLASLASLAASNERRVVNAFRAARALSGATARRLADLRLTSSAALRVLLTERVIRKAGAERYFLDESLWANRRRMSGLTMARVGIAAALAVGAGLVFWFGR